MLPLLEHANVAAMNVNQAMMRTTYLRQHYVSALTKAKSLQRWMWTSPWYVPRTYIGFLGTLVPRLSPLQRWMWTRPRNPQDSKGLYRLCLAMWMNLAQICLEVPMVHYPDQKSPSLQRWMRRRPRTILKNHDQRRFIGDIWRCKWIWHRYAWEHQWISPCNDECKHGPEILKIQRDVIALTFKGIYWEGLAMWFWPSNQRGFVSEVSAIWLNLAQKYLGATKGALSMKSIGRVLQWFLWTWSRNSQDSKGC